MKTIVVQNYSELRRVVQEHIADYGTHCDLNHIDISHLTSLFGVFDRIDFRGDISEWDVSNVSDFSYMFARSTFNGDISKWDMSSAEDTSYMFYESQFSGNVVSSWRLSNIKFSRSMFEKS